MRTTYEYEQNDGESVTKTFDSTGVGSTATYGVQTGPWPVF